MYILQPMESIVPRSLAFPLVEIKGEWTRGSMEMWPRYLRNLGNVFLAYISPLRGKDLFWFAPYVDRIAPSSLCECACVCVASVVGGKGLDSRLVILLARSAIIFEWCLLLTLQRHIILCIFSPVHSTGLERLCKRKTSPALVDAPYLDTGKSPSHVEWYLPVGRKLWFTREH